MVRPAGERGRGDQGAHADAGLGPRRDGGDLVHDRPPARDHELPGHQFHVPLRLAHEPQPGPVHLRQRLLGVSGTHEAFDRIVSLHRSHPHDGGCLLMSLRRAPRLNGRWVQTDQQDFWQISLTVQDPSIPNYPVETPSAGGVIEADGSSIGLGTPLAIGISLFQGVGDSIGLGTPTSLGAALWLSSVTSAGIAAGDAPSGILYAGGGSASGQATVNALSITVFTGLGAASGVSDPLGIGAALWLGQALSTGFAGDSVLAANIFASLGNINGTATSESISAALMTVLGEISGLSTVEGVGQEILGYVRKLITTQFITILRNIQ